jgi:hypothetical protein
MAAGDVEVYIASVDDDGTKLDAVLTGNGVVVADSVTMTSLPGSRVCVLVIKAA